MESTELTKDQMLKFQNAQLLLDIDTLKTMEKLNISIQKLNIFKGNIEKNKRIKTEIEQANEKQVFLVNKTKKEIEDIISSAEKIK